jgi:hypothetical protein
MNDHDRNNLNFLLHAEAEVLKDWAAKMEEDDIAYAQELLAMYAEELRERSAALLVEANLEKMAGNYPEACMVIKRVVDKPEE